MNDCENRDRSLCVWLSLKKQRKKQCAKQITELSEQLDIIIVSITSIYSVKLEESSTIDHVMVIGFIHYSVQALIGQEVNICIIAHCFDKHFARTDNLYSSHHRKQMLSIHLPHRNPQHIVSINLCENKSSTKIIYFLSYMVFFIFLFVSRLNAHK